MVRSARREKKRMAKQMFNQLDNIMIQSKRVCKEYDKRAIPLISLKIFINSAKGKMKGDKNHDLTMEQFNKVLDQLLVNCKAIAKKMQSKSIALITLQSGVDLIKKSFGEGLKEELK